MTEQEKTPNQVTAQPATPEPAYGQQQRLALEHIQRKQNEATAALKNLEQERAQYRQDLELVKLLRDNPELALKAAGHEKFISQRAPQPAPAQSDSEKLMGEIHGLRAEIQRMQQREEELQRASRMDSVLKEFEGHIATNERYAALNAAKTLGSEYGVMDIIRNRMQQQLDETGEVMEYDTVASEVNDYLAKLAEGIASKMGYVKRNPPMSNTPQTLTKQDSSIRPVVQQESAEPAPLELSTPKLIERLFKKQ